MKQFTIRKEKRRLSLFVRIIVIPLCFIALVLLSTGIYAFIGANKITRLPSETSEDFPANILPVFTNASFTSLDGLTKLEGWLFRTSQDPISTVIMIHGFGRDRLQFGSDTVRLYDFFLNKGFNVLSFDLRHSGVSGGNISTFGYTEWQDVLGAISYVRKTTSTTDAVLFGFGSGTAAALMAYEHLPEAGVDDEDIDYNIRVLGFDRSYIRAFILDCPQVTADDYIGLISSDKLPAGNSLGRIVVPYAVRLSSGMDHRYNLAAILSRTNLPVHLIHGEYSSEETLKSSQMTITERIRIFPDRTTVYEIPGQENGITPYCDILYDPSGYTGSLSDFISLFLPS